MGTKQYLFIGLLILSLIACEKKEVKLPLIDTPGLSEIQNHSSIWVFKKSENGRSVAELNKNNKIMNTHWIYNIDKGLPMREIVPILIAMQENKNKDSMHKKEGMLSYFSYADTNTKSISLLLFPQTTFISNQPLPQHEEETVDPCLLRIELFDEELKINGKTFNLELDSNDLAKYSTCKGDEELSAVLSFDEDTSYQSYLETKVFLHEQGIKLNTSEYFHSLK